MRVVTGAALAGQPLASLCERGVGFLSLHLEHAMEPVVERSSIACGVGASASAVHLEHAMEPVVERSSIRPSDSARGRTVEHAPRRLRSR